MTDINLPMQESGALGFWHRYRALIVALALCVAIIGWLAISKGMAVKQAEEAAAAQRTELIRRMQAAQTEATKQSLTMFAMPLAWAVRREMMADNLDQVDQYVTDLVKQKGFEQVVVAKADGVVAVASDRKNLGLPFNKLYSESYLNAEQIIVEESAPGKWQVIVPVMGLNARLGIVAINYLSPIPEFVE